ncbi:MAG: nucleoside 2-deoxyribosyltransferase [Butyricicoccus sp.]|nr:nucleoside 2-deoxyribosyltransferase [Butyricicoccus sp.]
MKKIYIAGFDVFAPDAVRRGGEMKRICAEYGFVGLYPLDNEAADAEAIFRGNCALIDQVDLVIANMNPFRGDEPDSGTSFEVGYAFAKGKTIVLYLDDVRPLREKLGSTDAQGFAVEDFGLPVNLMLACAAQVVDGGFANAVRYAAAHTGIIGGK